MGAISCRARGWADCFANTPNADLVAAYSHPTDYSVSISALSTGAPAQGSEPNEAVLRQWPKLGHGTLGQWP
jgi:hypothetical protein